MLRLLASAACVFVGATTSDAASAVLTRSSATLPPAGPTAIQDPCPRDAKRAVCGGHVNVPLDRSNPFAGPIGIHFELYVHRRMYVSEDLNHLTVAGHAWAARVAWAAMRHARFVR